MKLNNYFLLLLFFIMQGCSLFGLLNEPEVIAPVTPPPKEKPVRFSENPNMGVFNANKYKHMTKSQLEDENEVHARAGSLWNNDGQSAYLFSQNTIRKEGELLKIKLDGVSRNQVETKVNVIKKLLARIEVQPQLPPPGIPNDLNNPNNGSPGGVLAANTTGVANAPNSATVRTPASDSANQNLTTPVSASVVPTAPVAGGGSVNLVSNNLKSTATAADEISNAEFNVDTIPTRIVERLVDGNYRVKGSQIFMIGKREFKVIAMGLVRPDDFNEDGISSAKLLDPQFDVVSLRRSQQ